jgi:hypothetical protein
MGMYTEIHFRAELVSDVPEEVLAVLRHLVDWEEPEPETLPDHELFQCPRWDMLGQCSSAYFPDHPESSLTFEGVGLRRWSVFLNADLKNYGSEIEKFFDWIDPYVRGSQGQFLGYSLYEEDDNPIIYHKKSPSKWK